MIPNERFLSGRHRWQHEVLRAFDAKLAQFYMLEWHRRARKTTLALNLLIRECIEHERRPYIYIAPTYTQARNIVWDDPNMLAAYLPDQKEMGWKRNEQKLHVRFANGSLLNIRGADKPESLRGIDAAGVVFDEWGLMRPEMWQEIFRPIIAQDASRWAMFLYTPTGLNHAPEMFDHAACLDTERELPECGVASRLAPGWFASRLIASKSGILSNVELQKARLDIPSWMYDQEFECARITDEQLALITSRMLNELQHLHKLHPHTRKIIACDPSTGGTECVIYAAENTQIIDELYLYERDPMKIVSHLAIMGRKHGISDYIIDTIGLGEGISSRAIELGLNVIPFKGSEAALYDERFLNQRAEAWWYAMEQVQDHQAAYPADLELRRQLTNVYLVPPGSGKKLQMERKHLVVKRIGRSPDRADTWVMMLWGTQFVQPEETKPTATHSHYEPVHAGAVSPDDDWRGM